MLIVSELQISRTAVVHVDDDSLIAAHIGTEGAPYLALTVHCSHSQNKASPKSKHQLGDHQGDSLPCICLNFHGLARLLQGHLSPFAFCLVCTHRQQAAEVSSSSWPWRWCCPLAFSHGGVLTLPTLPTRADWLWAICTGLTQRGSMSSAFAPTNRPRLHNCRPRRLGKEWAGEMDEPLRVANASGGRMLRHRWAWARGAIVRLLFYLPLWFPLWPLMLGHKQTALKTYLGRDVTSMFYSACSQNTTQHPHVWGKIPTLSLRSHLCSLDPSFLQLTSQRAAAGKNRHEMRQLSGLRMENWDMVYDLCSLSSSKIRTRAFSTEAASPAAQPMITG